MKKMTKNQICQQGVFVQYLSLWGKAQWNNFINNLPHIDLKVLVQPDQCVTSMLSAKNAFVIFVLLYKVCANKK